MLRFGKATYVSLTFKFVLSESFCNSPWRSDIPLFLELINIVPILFYNFTELIILFYTFLVISFALYKEYMICLFSFSKFLDVLRIFTCARAIGNLWSICLGVNILCCVNSKTLRLETLATPANSEERPLPFFCLLKSIIFSTILTTFSDFHFQEFLYLTDFLKSISFLLLFLFWFW